MKRILDLAITEERRVCKEMGRVQQSLDAETGRLDELESYRHTYAQQFQSNDTISPVRWQDYQYFLQRIDQAVAAQKEHVMTGQRSRDAHRRRWLVKKQKLDSLERIVNRLRIEENQEAERRNQRTLDDLSFKGLFSHGRSED